MSSSQVAAPYAIRPTQQPNLSLLTSQDFYSSLSATMESHRPSTPVHRILEDDYTVPAPPPPSPVSFRTDGWPKPAHR
ncbi:hypothetical protein PT974_11579 [Cladobotryum mycophilum]|uniref:Uncharacterized protein n=1 Tax=Cladobotryum mycophilum TaxID=491253 RepID=A0ABR0S6H1_9HYPO